MKSLPLGLGNLLTFDLIPIAPLLPLGMLMKRNSSLSLRAGGPKRNFGHPAPEESQGRSRL